MAVCLHKLVRRISVFNPVLLQCRQFAAPTLVYREKIDPKRIRATVSVSKPILLNADANFLTQNIRCFSKTTTNLDDATSNQSTSDGGANEEQLSIIYDRLREDLPLIFIRPMDYSKVHKDIVFENRIHGKTYNGILAYVKQLSFLRLYGHFMYAYVKMDVIKMTKHTEDSTIKVRWRICGISGYRILFKMIQFRVWDPKKMIEQHQQVWIDGFSTLYVNSDGFVIRHIADKVMPDQDKEASTIEKVVDKLGQNIPKLALFLEISNISTDIVV